MVTAYDWTCQHTQSKVNIRLSTCRIMSHHVASHSCLISNPFTSKACPTLPAITTPKQCPRPQEAPTLAAVRGGINLNMANILVMFGEKTCHTKQEEVPTSLLINLISHITPVHYTRGTTLSCKLSEVKASSHPVFAHTLMIQMENVQ